MFAKLKTLTIIAAACATLSTAAIAQVVVRVGPPPPRVEVVPAARSGYVWTPGYWAWRNHRHVWTNGVWVRERRGYVYRQPGWVEDNGRWRFNRGNWARGDRDGDGIPNRMDRHPDNPRRP